ncbi:restriction endonuclease subunit S [Streptococcus sp. FT1-55]|uniref:restriction endonuclease subunit S n=1 Tax=Streptococcus sp. FT1-55 TaxID=3409805 RepID=UPI003BF60B3E
MTYIADLIKEHCPNGVEWKELGEVCVVKTGQQINKTFIQNNLGRYPVVNSGKEPLGFVNVYNTEDDPIGITSRGAGVGYVSWNEGKYFRGNLNYSSTIKDSNVILPKFLYYFLKNSFKAIENLCTFEGIPALNKSNLEMLKIPIPPLKIQEEIVQILDKFTEYVTELTAELTAELTDRQKQYSFYRDKLLSFEDEIYQVEWKTLGEVLIKGRGTKITAGQMKSLHKEGAPVRIFAGGKTFADVNYGDIPDKDVHSEEAIIVKSRGIIDFEYYTKPFSFKNEFWSYSSENELINLKYVHYYLDNNKEHFQKIANNMQMPQISSVDTEKYKIPIPPLPIQQRIVQVLDNFDTVCNDLNIGLPKEIELRQKQYEYFRDKLLTFTAEGVYTDSTVQYRQDLIRLLNWVFGPIRVELGAVARYGNQKISTGDLSPKSYIGVDNLLQNRAGKLDATYLPENVNVNIYKEGNILIGNIRPYLKKIWFAINSGGASPDVLVVQNQVKDCLVNRYLYHILANDRFFEFDMQNAKGSKMPRGDKGAVLYYQFILPTFSDQFRIVAILDKFNELTTSISQGLPKEIELRQKQYEYFRDQLLNFS